MSATIKYRKQAILCPELHKIYFHITEGIISQTPGVLFKYEAFLLIHEIQLPSEPAVIYLVFHLFVSCDKEQ